MSNLQETPVWVDSIYQLTEDTPVLGKQKDVPGDGPANIQAEQLANRTQYLKAMMESIADGKEYTFYKTASDPDGTIAGIHGTETGKIFRVVQGEGEVFSFKYYLNDSGNPILVAWLIGQGSISNNIRFFSTLSLAEKDLSAGNILPDARAYIQSDDDLWMAYECINVGGILTATGRRIPSDIVASKLMPLITLSETTTFMEMTELNDEYDSVLVDSEYNILVALKNGLFDFCGLSVNGKSINPAGILETMDKTNLEALSETTTFASAGSEYELNPKKYILLDEEKNILFDIDDYMERSEQWQQGYLFSLQPQKVNPYAPFTQLDAAGKSQIRVYDTENNIEIAVTSGSSNETNPRPDVLDRIVWTSDRADNAPGGLFYAEGPDFKEFPYIARPKIVGWGDSFMENTRFMNRLAELTGLYCYNFGKSSLQSTGVVARQGGAQTVYVPVGGLIPASGSITLLPAVPGPLAAFGNASMSSIAVTYAGVAGMFGWDGSVATFTRNSSGTTVAVSSPTPIEVIPTTTQAVTNGAPAGTVYTDHNQCICLLTMGRNNISQTDVVVSNYHSAIKSLKNVGIRPVVIPQFPGSGESTGTNNNTYVHLLNARLKVELPEYYVEIDGVDLLQNFINHHNPTSAGDLEDIANGVTPRSLRYDWLHPSQSLSNSVTPEYAIYVGAEVNAEFVYQFMKRKGWVL